MNDIDITQDLVDGRDGALGDTPQFSQSSDARPVAPAGSQSVFGTDATHVNNTDEPHSNQQQQREPSLRDQLSSAFKGTEGQPTDQANAQPAKPEPQQTPPALTKDGEGKYRLADGTFASAQQVQAFEAAQSANTNQQQQSQSPATSGMTPVEQQQFQSLPAELRQYVERTMEDLNTRATRYSEYDLIEQSILGPRRQAFAAEGTTPAVALNQLFALSDFAGRDPGNFVLWFAQQRGLDLDALQDARDAANANTSPEVQELRGKVQQLEGSLSQFQQQGAQATHTANLTAVQNFAQAKDGTGALVRPHITEVMDQWAQQIRALRTANPTMPNHEVLQKAYDNACWLNPTVRGKLQEAAQATARAEAAARTNAARTAGSSVTGAPAGDTGRAPSNSGLSLRDELTQQFAAARAV